MDDGFKGTRCMHILKLTVVVIILLMMNVRRPIKALLILLTAGRPFLKLIFTEIDVASLSDGLGAPRLLWSA